MRLPDRTAACLIAERVLMAAVSSLVAIDASREEPAVDHVAAPQPPLVD